MKKIVMTGAGGQIGYSLAFRLIKKQIKNEPVKIILNDLPRAKKKLEGLALELEDCAQTGVKIEVETELEKAFDQVDLALCIGSKPRSKGMERKDLLLENAKIFVKAGKALNEAASKNVKVLVVGNPCNTNCLIALHHAPSLNKDNFYAMMALDELRAKNQLAIQLDKDVSRITQLAVWGNHSTTQVPDLWNASVEGKKALDLVSYEWFESTLLPRVRKRGSEVIEARGFSSSGSAANAILYWIDSMQCSTASKDCFSAAVHTENNPYGIDPNLVFGFPLVSNGSFETTIRNDFEMPESLKIKLKETEKELIEERSLVNSLLLVKR